MPTPKRKEIHMSASVISPQGLYERIQSGQAVELIDVRTPVEFREMHIAAAKNTPLDKLDPAAFAAAGAGRNRPLFVVCRTGSRAKQASEKLIAAGCTNVVQIEGGSLAWEQSGLPVVRGEKAISLERQVRIAAGSLVLTGAALAVWVHPYFIGLSAFVGAGLVFAGVTDTCGMGMLLARMPWNQTTPPAATIDPNAQATCSVK
jgi:rhodanese-related sulfurtransferase